VRSVLLKVGFRHENKSAETAYYPIRKQTFKLTIDHPFREVQNNEMSCPTGFEASEMAPAAGLAAKPIVRRQGKQPYLIPIVHASANNRLPLRENGSLWGFSLLKRSIT
jgi:hypothetical protein